MIGAILRIGMVMSFGILSDVQVSNGALGFAARTLRRLSFLGWRWRRGNWLCGSRIWLAITTSLLEANVLICHFCLPSWEEGAVEWVDLADFYPGWQHAHRSLLLATPHLEVEFVLCYP